MSEARSIRDAGEERILLAATLDPYQVIQTPTGRAGFYDSPSAKASGSYAVVKTSGQARMAKTTSMYLLAGGRAYWDHSANAVSYRKNGDKDFYVGRVAEDTTAADTQVLINLNDDPPYDRDLARDGFASVLVGTPAAGGFGYPVNLGGTLIFELTATNEAQKVDALGIDSFSKDANAIVEFAFRVISDGGSGAQDATVGIASATDASDFQSVAEFVAMHLDGNVTNINFESDDGATDVPPTTDSTKDYTEGATLACRKEVWLDLRNPNDVQIYVDAELVLDATTFTLANAVGTMFLIVHLEKTATTDTYKLAIDWLRARFSEQ